MTVWASDSVWMFLGVVLAFHLGRVWQFYKDERRGRDRSLAQLWRDWRSDDATDAEVRRAIEAVDGEQS
jgi:hypothetical protein